MARVSRVSLGLHWAQLAPQQTQEFVTLFGDLFEESYKFLGESQATYGTVSIDNNRALVHTTLIRKGGRRAPGRLPPFVQRPEMAVSDVVVDGVSLATNFQAQFDQVMRPVSYEVLVEKMKAKLEQERSKDL